MTWETLLPAMALLLGVYFGLDYVRGAATHAELWRTLKARIAGRSCLFAYWAMVVWASPVLGWIFVPVLMWTWWSTAKTIRWACAYRRVALEEGWLVVDNGLAAS